MACAWIEGFESHAATGQFQRKYASFSGSWTIQSGRVFGNAGAVTSTVCVTPVIGSGNTFVLGFGFRFAAHTTVLNSGNQGLYCELGVNEQFHLEMESGSGLGVRFHIKRGSTTVATSSYFDFGVWHYIELKVTVRTSTNGAYELRHNGVLDISGSGVNLANSGADGWNVFAFRYTSNVSTTLRYDDMYVLDGTGSKNNDFLGPSVVEGLLPNANGATIQWTNNAGSGSNYENVDDAANAAPDETGVGGTNGSDTNGQKDLYAFEDLSQITGTIHAVQLGVQLGMASAGTRTVKTKYRDPDTTEADGASHVVDSTVFDEFTEIFDDNPASAAAWDVTDIDGGQFGVEVVS